MYPDRTKRHQSKLTVIKLQLVDDLDSIAEQYCEDPKEAKDEVSITSTHLIDTTGKPRDAVPDNEP